MEDNMARKKAAKPAEAKKEPATKSKAKAKASEDIVLNDKSTKSGGVKMVKVKCLWSGTCAYGVYKLKMEKDKVISVIPEVKEWLAKCGKIY
jgi:hypothetical protein